MFSKAAVWFPIIYARSFHANGLGSLFEQDRETTRVFSLLATHSREMSTTHCRFPLLTSSSPIRTRASTGALAGVQLRVENIRWRCLHWGRGERLGNRNHIYKLMDGVAERKWSCDMTHPSSSIHGHTHVKDERVKLRVDWLCGETRDGLREKFYYGNWERFWCLKCSGALDTAPVERRLMWYLWSVVQIYKSMTARCGSAISAGNQSTLVSVKFVIHHLKLQHLNYVKMISLKRVLVRWVKIFSGY